MCQHQKWEISYEILSNACSFTNWKGKEVWDIFLDSQRCEGIALSIPFQLLCRYEFKKSLRIKFFCIFPIFFTRVQFIVVYEDNCVLEHAITTDLWIFCRHMWHDRWWWIPQAFKNCGYCVRHVFNVVERHFRLAILCDDLNFFLNARANVWVFCDETECKVNKISCKYKLLEIFKHLLLKVYPTDCWMSSQKILEHVNYGITRKILLVWQRSQQSVNEIILAFSLCSQLFFPRVDDSFQDEFSDILCPCLEFLHMRLIKGTEPWKKIDSISLINLPKDLVKVSSHVFKFSIIIIKSCGAHVEQKEIRTRLHYQRLQMNFTFTADRLAHSIDEFLNFRAANVIHFLEEISVVTWRAMFSSKVSTLLLKCGPIAQCECCERRRKLVWIFFMPATFYTHPGAFYKLK